MDGGLFTEHQKKQAIVFTRKEDEWRQQAPLVKEVGIRENASMEDKLTDRIRGRIKQNTDRVPPEIITVAAGEKVQDILFDRNAEGILLPVNGRELLQREPSGFTDVELQNSPGMQLKRALADVATDSKWYGDSEQRRALLYERQRREGFPRGQRLDL